MCSLINIKLISFSFILLLIMTGKIVNAAHGAGCVSRFVSRGEAARRADPAAAARADAIEAAADQEFLKSVTADPKYLRTARLKFEDYDMAIIAAVNAANAESYRTYDSSLIEQERFHFRRLEHVRAELATIKEQLAYEKTYVGTIECELVELRAKVPASGSSASTLALGKPPLPPSRGRSRTSPSGSGLGVLE